MALMKLRCWDCNFKTLPFYKYESLFIFFLIASCPFSRQNAEQELNETVENLDSNDVADPETTTPNNCVCTSICSCGVGCDPGLPIPLGETKDWCTTGLFQINF